MHANKMNRGIFNPFMTEAVIIDWFLYDNGLRHKRVKWILKSYDAVSDCFGYDS